MEDTFDSLFKEAEHFEGKRAKIKCVGIGGGGGNAINRMVASGIKDVDFIAVNTDAQDLRRNIAPFLVQVGESSLKGLGVGGDPELGKKAAEESIAQLEALVDDTDLLFITAGMGGGTGTGVAPELARVAKEKYGDNILVVGVVTRPFASEGYLKEKRADKGIKEIQKYADCVLVIPNERLFEIIDAKTSNEQAFKMVDEVLLQAVKGISEVILNPGEVNIDYNDLKRIMLKSGHAMVGVGEATGPQRHIEALRKALTSPLLENTDIRGAKGFIISFTAASEIKMFEQGEVMNIMRQYTGSNSLTKFGYNYDKNLPPDVLKVVVIVAAFSKDGVPQTIRIARNMEGTRCKSPQLVGSLPTRCSAYSKGESLNSVVDKKYIPAYIRYKKEGK